MRVFALLLLGTGVSAARLALRNRAGDSGDNGIGQVITELQNLQKSSAADFKAQEKDYKLAQCFCRTNTEERDASIKTETKNLEDAQARLESARADNGDASTQLQDTKAKLEALETEMDTRDALEKQQVKDFDAEKLDLEDGISKLEGAIEQLAEVGADQTEAGSSAEAKALKAGNIAGGESLAQFTKQMKAVLIELKDLAPPKIQQKIALLQAQPNAYTPASSEVTGILKSMLDTFNQKLTDGVALRSAQKEAYDAFFKASTKEKGALNDLRTKLEGEIGDNSDDVNTALTDVKNAEDQIAADKEFLAALKTSCNDQDAAWNKFQAAYSSQQAAVAKAISILNDDSVFEARNRGVKTQKSTIKVAEGPKSLLQLSFLQFPISVSRRLHQLALSTQSSRIARLAVFARQAPSEGNPFKTLFAKIDEMIALIGQEEKDDDAMDKKCTKDIKQNEDDQETTQGTIDDLKASIDLLKDEIKTLADKIKDGEDAVAALEKDMADATDLRQEESETHKTHTQDVTTASDAIKMAINVLTNLVSVTGEWKANLDDVEERPVKIEQSSDDNTVYVSDKQNNWKTPLEGKVVSKAGSQVLDGDFGTWTLNADGTQISGYPGGDLHKVGGGQNSAEIDADIKTAHDKMVKEGGGSGKGGAFNPAPDTDGLAGVISLLQDTAASYEAEQTEADGFEKDSKQNFQDTMTAMTASKDKEMKAIRANEKEKGEKEQSLEEDEDSLENNEKKLKELKTQNSNLHMACDPLQNNLKDRIQKRKDEKAGLEKAKSILRDEAPAFANSEGDAKAAIINEKCKDMREVAKDADCVQMSGVWKSGDKSVQIQQGKSSRTGGTKGDGSQFMAEGADTAGWGKGGSINHADKTITVGTNTAKVEGGKVTLGDDTWTKN